MRAALTVKGNTTHMGTNSHVKMAGALGVSLLQLCELTVSGENLLQDLRPDPFLSLSLSFILFYFFYSTFLSLSLSLYLPPCTAKSRS